MSTNGSKESKEPDYDEDKDQIAQTLTLKSSEQIPHTTLVENATQTERRKHANRGYRGSLTIHTR
jgi:hypothetical protein